MKILKVETYILSAPLGDLQFYSSQCAFPKRTSLVVKIETDEGIIGWGEGGQYGPPEPVAACIDTVLAPLILGADPLKPMVVWEKLYSHTRDFGQKGAYIEAISAIDIALWDISGKALNIPVHQMMGGSFRERVIAYATGGYYTQQEFENRKNDISRITEEAVGFVSQGFSIFKTKIGLMSLKEDVDKIRKTREAIGEKTKLLIDANHAYNATTALRMGLLLEEYSIGWFEEPVVPEDLEGYRFLRQRLSMPIAGGEAEFTRFGFRRLIDDGCVDIVQPDICCCGGFSEFQKIIAIASSFGVWVIPHVWGSGIAFAAALHGLAIMPPFPHTALLHPLQNEPVIEFDQSPNPLREELLCDKIELIDGFVPVPQKAGLGIEINEDALDHFNRK